MNDTRTEPTLHAVSTAGRYDEPTAAFGTQPDQWPEPRGHVQRRRTGWLVALLLLSAGAAVVSMLWQPRSVPPVPVATPKHAAPPSADNAQPRYPIEAAVAALPPLEGSDATILAALQTLMRGGLASLLDTRDLIRNFVATVDNLPRRALPPQKLPTRPVSGKFGTAASGTALVIGESNAQRYAPYVKLLQGADLAGLVTLYAQNYPLFQQAYRELGYPNGHFNDRLVEAIDVMLAAPESPTPLKLVQPKIFYEFADRDLEQLPAGQKLMLRMGSDNGAVVKKQLRELRALVTAQGPAKPVTAEPAAKN